MGIEPPPPEPPDAYIGKKAVDLGLLTAQQLAAVLTEMSRAGNGTPTLGLTLVARGLLTQQQLGVLSDIAKGAPPKKVGRYRIVRELGRGGMGVVYEAQDPELGRCVALKMLLGAGELSQEDRSLEEDRFTREARLSANLPKHPNIVGVYEAGVDDDQRYIAMEFVEGSHFSEWGKSKSLRQQVAVLRDVALAVDHAHRHGIIHRDLKPANILVDASSQPHVTDFGLAKRGQSEATFALTMSGAIMGTPAYMSPEQASGKREVDARIDVWALGVMLYEILTGRVPFEAETPLKMIMKTANDPVTPPSTVARGTVIDRSVEGICMKALSKNPDRRHATARAFADDLTRWLKGDKSAGATARKAPASAAWKLWAGIGAAAAVAIVALIATSGPSAEELKAERVRDLVAQGQRLLAQKQYSDALNKFGAALEEDRGHRAAAAGKKEAEEKLFSSRSPAEDPERKARAADAAKLREEIKKDLAELDLAVAVHRGAETFGAARDLVVQAAKRRDDPEWKTETAARLETIRKQADELFAKVRDAALDAKRTGDAAAADAARARVSKWKWAATAQELDDALAKVTPQAPQVSLVERDPLQGLSNAANSLSFGPDGRVLLTASFDGTVRLWDVPARTEKALLLKGPFPSSSATSPDGRWYASGAQDFKIRIWDAASLKMRTLNLHTGQVTGIAFAPDSSSMATTSVDGSVAIWDPSGGTVRTQKGGHPKGAMSVAISPDGRYVASGAADQVIRLWELPDCREVRKFDTGPDFSTTAMAFSPDSKHLFSGGKRGEVTMWEIETGRPKVVVTHSKPLHGIAVSPDGRWLASTSTEGLKLWDRTSAAAKLEIVENTGFYGVAFSKTGNLLASCNGSWVVRIWELTSGRPK
jgi:WD40 repeat protein